jgi:hypothetical protein
VCYQFVVLMSVEEILVSCISNFCSTCVLGVLRSLYTSADSCGEAQVNIHVFIVLGFYLYIDGGSNKVPAAEFI